MTKGTPKKRGRPPKNKRAVPGAVVPGAVVPNQGEQQAMIDLLQRFLVATQQKNLERAVRFRDELVHMLDRFAGLK